MRLPKLKLNISWFHRVFLYLNDEQQSALCFPIHHDLKNRGFLYSNDKKVKYPEKTKGDYFYLCIFLAPS